MYLCLYKLYTHTVYWTKCRRQKRAINFKVKTQRTRRVFYKFFYFILFKKKNCILRGKNLIKFSILFLVFKNMF